jgi:hypothetical protein
MSRCSIERSTGAESACFVATLSQDPDRAGTGVSRLACETVAGRKRDPPTFGMLASCEIDF